MIYINVRKKYTSVFLLAYTKAVKSLLLLFNCMNYKIFGT
jgi:hypothetical protein